MPQHSLALAGELAVRLATVFVKNISSVLPAGLPGRFLISAYDGL